MGPFFESQFAVTSHFPLRQSIDFRYLSHTKICLLHCPATSSPTFTANLYTSNGCYPRLLWYLLSPFLNLLQHIPKPPLLLLNMGTSNHVSTASPDRTPGLLRHAIHILLDTYTALHS